MDEHTLLSFFEDETVAEYASEADADSDSVSIPYLVVGEDRPGPEHLPNETDVMVGAMVFLKGADVVEEFKAWAANRGHLTLGKPIAE